MKKLLTIVFVLTCFFAEAQTWQQIFARSRFVFGLGIPVKDTITGTAADSAQLVLRPQNGALYYRYKTAWIQLAASVGNAVDSIWLTGGDPDTLRYRSLGITYTVGVITGGGGGAVSSVFGRTGAVTALEADYSAFYPLLSGTYNNPSWLNQLAWSKITGTPTTLAGYGITTPIAIADGGTGQTTANAAINALLPNQTGNANKYLKTDGSNTSWQDVPLPEVDSARLADSIAAVRYSVSGESVAWGTYSQRVALNGTVPTGHKFYQTNERAGLWVKSTDTSWHLLPDYTIFKPNQYNWYGSQVGGTGASVTSMLNYSTTNDEGFVLAGINTGTTSTGFAAIVPNSNLNVWGVPIDTLPSTISRHVLHGQINLSTAPTDADNYIFYFGFRTVNAPTVDSTNTAYGVYFRISWHRSDSVQIYIQSNGGSVSQTAQTIPISQVVGRYADYVIVYTNRRAWFYIDGTFLGYLNLDGVANVNNLLGGGAPMLGIAKLSGTNSRGAFIKKLTYYKYAE